VTKLLFVRGEERDDLRDLVGIAHPAQRNLLGEHRAELRLLFLRRREAVDPGVWIGPGLTALTRMLRALSSLALVRANERTAAFVAL
jgi:hypothetical protein